jgi:hypothetical protein
MPSKKVIYECKYCGKAYSYYDECDECEKSHLRDFSKADTQEIVEELRLIGAIACGYHIGYTVMGMPLSNFESLITEAAKRLETKSKRKG